MSANTAYDADELLATVDRFDAVAPWYASRRLWAAAAIALALVGEIVWIARSRDPLAAQRKAVAALDQTEKAELSERWDRFSKLTPDEQERLRDLHVGIESDADPAELRSVLAAYQQWKTGLSPIESATLVGLEPPARLAQIREVAAEQQTALARSLTDEDAKKIVAWLERQVDGFQDKLLVALPEDVRKRFESLDRRQRNWSLIMSLVSYRSGGGSPVGPRLENLTPAALAELHDELSPAAQRVWDSAGSLDERKQLLGDWIRQAVFRQMPHRDGGASRIDEAELRRFFDHDLTDGERTRYLSLPHDEMQSQLRREYLRRKGLWKEPGFGDGMFGRPPYGRGPGNPSDRRPSLGPGSGPRNGSPKDGR